ncbi:MAG: anti-sigma factor [Halofilum sp. (in: g-proteobacteria)]|nr:anti-sigma factor [Halofilum sp. (in: g-proteobacteria)]
MSDAAEQREQLDELLVQRAVEGLDPVDSAELERLLARTGDVDPDAFDEAAAWFWLGAGDAEQPLPRAVAERTLAAVPAEGGGESRVTPLRPRRTRRTAPWGGWLAAAAALLLALAGWWPRLQPGEPPSPAAARDELIATAPDLTRVEWNSTDHPRAQRLAGGYVVWSDALQEGYMTFRSMPDNDPNRHQYQLWVFDAARSDQYPVDGGVFDAGEDREVVIPIRTRLPVQQAKLFAVTLEPPGGVVVSDRDPILWVARPGTES